MPKFISRFFTLIISISVVYGILWFSGAALLKNKVVHDIEKLKKHNVVISYDGSIGLGGFPFHIAMNFNNPKIVAPLKHNNLSWSAESLSISSDLLTKNFSAISGTKTTTEFQGETHSSSCLTNVVNIKLHAPLLFRKDLEHITDFKSLVSTIQNISTTLSKCQSVNEKTQAQFYIDNAHLAAELEYDHDAHNIAMVGLNGTSTFNTDQPHDGIKPEPINAYIGMVFRFSYIKENDLYLPSLVKMDIASLGFKTNNSGASLDLKGQMEAAKVNTFVPSGQLNVAMGHYNIILNSLQETGIVKHKDKIKALLEKIAEAKEEDQDLAFKIEHTSDGNFKIGALSFAELIALFYSTR